MTIHIFQFNLLHREIITQVMLMCLKLYLVNLFIFSSKDIKSLQSTAKLTRESNSLYVDDASNWSLTAKVRLLFYVYKHNLKLFGTSCF